MFAACAIRDLIIAVLVTAVLCLALAGPRRATPSETPRAMPPSRAAAAPGADHAHVASRAGAASSPGARPAISFSARFGGAQ